MVKRRSNLLIPTLVLLAVLGGWFFWRPKLQTPSVNVATEPSPNPEVTTTGIAADGTISLTLNQKPTGNKNMWSLIIKDKNNPQKTIWSESLPDSVSFSIPLNAVSPDNKSLFIRETAPGKTLYLVFFTSGKPINKDSQLIEFTDLFAAKYPDLQITEATGWAAPTLIVFNTNQADGHPGPSFWFDIVSLSFIQLSNRFN